MAVLSDTDRFETTGEVMREDNLNFKISEVIGNLTKPQIREVINALDDFLNTNASAINSAIPQPQRGLLTTSQKAAILVYVIRKRYIKGS